MNATATLLTLLHLLIPIYWLGGDLGAFYGSGFLLDPKRSVPERLMSLTILNNIDMAPRTALILAFPTGFALAWNKGWLDVGTEWIVLASVLSLAWLALAWAVHLRHGPAAQGLKRVDLVIRFAVLLGLVAGAVAGMTGTWQIPLFIGLKMLALAICISLGLVVRRQLVPLFPAIVKLRESGGSPEVDGAIAGVLAKTRPTVILLWVVVLGASALGIATPV